MKIYKNRMVIPGLVMLSIFTILSLVLLIVGGLLSSIGFIITAIFSIALISFLWTILMYRNIFKPILINDIRIKYKNTIINWEDVRFVAYPYITRSYEWGYLLVFFDHYLSGKELRNKIKEGFYISLSIKSLQLLSKYYQKEIKIIDVQDRNIFVKELHSSAKINELFTQHNSIH